MLAIRFVIQQLMSVSIMWLLVMTLLIINSRFLHSQSRLFGYLMAVLELLGPVVVGYVAPRYLPGRYRYAVWMFALPAIGLAYSFFGSVERIGMQESMAKFLGQRASTARNTDDEGLTVFF